MKKFILSLGLIAMAFGLTNCTQNDDFDAPMQPAQEYDLYVATPRTINSGVNTFWADGDALTVFHAVAESSDFVKDAEFTLVDAETGHFKGDLKEGATLTEAAYDWYACYPYSAAADFTKPGVGRSFIIGNTNNVGKQTQTGNNSMSHLAGNNLPLVGVAKGVAANESPALSMQHAASMAKFIVKNELEEPITINSIEFAAPNHDITGYFFIDFTDMENISYRPDSGKTASSTKLIVSNGSPIAVGATAEFYLAVAPFTKEAGSDATITITATNGEGVVGECIKDATAATMTFTAGKFKDITLRYNTTFESLPSVSTESEPYIVGFEASESFTASTSYKVADVRYTGAEDKQWGTVYGTPSTTGKISGEQCMHIKTYPIDGAWSESYTFTNFALSTVKQLQFAAASENYNNLKVSYRVVGGAWTDLPTFELSNNAATYNHVFDTAVQNVQFKFTIVPTRSVSGTSGKYVVIDNVVFAGEELAEDFRPVAASVKATTGAAADVETDNGTTATLNGSYELYDAVGDESVVCGFDWKASTAGSYTTVTATADGKNFSYALTGLTAGVEYTFRAWASLDSGTTKAYGEEKTFKTTITAPSTGGQWVRVTNAATILAGGTFIIGYEATAGSGIIVPMRNDGADATTRGDGYFYAGTTSGSSTNGTINMTTISDTKVYELTITANTVVANTINIQLANGNYIGTGSTKSGVGRLYTSAGQATAYSVTMGSNDTVVVYCAYIKNAENNGKYLQYNVKSPRFGHYANSQSNPVFYKWVE